MDAVHRRGYTTPTDIQRQAIPLVLEGRDVLGGAQTGTGKTAAFALPILHRLRERAPGVLRCLVLAPTRELALQVAESFRDYGAFLPLTCGTAFGGVEMWHQELMLRQGVDVLVATPGRLLDHIHRGNLDFGALEVAVLDEADRMLDMGFIDDVRQIMSCLPRARQTLLFSATLDPHITRLARDLLRDPVSVQVAPTVTTAPEGLRQVVFHVDAERKRQLLRNLIDRHRMSQAIVFVRTKDGADRLARFLEHTGVSVDALHSNKSQSARLAVLEGFRAGRIRVLVATDIAARGLDITTVSHVINYDVPRCAEDYVHRVGRTARAGDTGDAITLVAPFERRLVQDIEWTLGDRIPVSEVPGYTLPVAPGARGAAPAAVTASGAGAGAGAHRSGPPGREEARGRGRRERRPVPGGRTHGEGEPPLPEIAPVARPPLRGRTRRRFW
jgi:ATP-dependent RNA helicase RhlE